MSKITASELNSYFSEISDSILYPEKQKKEIISRLRNDVEAFLEENAQADLNEVIAVFGSAQTISRGFMENTDPRTIAGKLRLRKYILAAVIVALVIYALFVVLSLVDVHQEAHGYIEEGIMMINNRFFGGEVL